MQQAIRQQPSMVHTIMIEQLFGQQHFCNNRSFCTLVLQFWPFVDSQMPSVAALFYFQGCLAVKRVQIELERIFQKARLECFTSPQAYTQDTGWTTAYRTNMIQYLCTFYCTNFPFTDRFRSSSMETYSAPSVAFCLPTPLCNSQCTESTSFPKG